MHMRAAAVLPLKPHPVVEYSNIVGLDELHNSLIEEPVCDGWILNDSFSSACFGVRIYILESGSLGLVRRASTGHCRSAALCEKIWWEGLECRPWRAVESVDGISTAWCVADWMHSAGHDWRKPPLVFPPCHEARPVTAVHHQDAVSRTLGPCARRLTAVQPLAQSLIEWPLERKTG